jgi:hypothetical protein
MAAHRAMFAGITLAIWLGHRRVLQAGGYTIREFWRAAWTKMRHAWRLMNPKAYQRNAGTAAGRAPALQPVAV